jgi:hemerythrin-like domain-containing protein
LTHPIDELMQDHRIIEQVLACLEQTEPPQSVEFYERAIDFITQFADGHHHDKEEHQLFPALAAQGMPTEGGPIACMLHEHEEGRGYVARMRAAVAAEDVAAAARAGADYAGLLRDHIAKEDNILFQMAREMLPAAVIDKLATDFETIESTTPRQSQYRQLAQELAQAVGGPTASPA